jgi:putative ABC transport system ATP-binding protein
MEDRLFADHAGIPLAMTSTELVARLTPNIGKRFLRQRDEAPKMLRPHTEHPPIARCRPRDDRPLNSITLEAKNLSLSVKNKVLLSDISVHVQPGEVLAVIGASGAGKSSFLRLLNRLDEPTGGTVLINGEDYHAISPPQLRRRVGMVMQLPYLFAGTVAANIAFGPAQRGERFTPERITALLDRVRLSGYQDRDVRSLSGGEVQRVSLARTLANAPAALLLDEPTSALDDTSARGIEELVLGIVHERRMTCVIVTHNMSQAARLAARTMVLNSGKLVALGSTTEVLGAL